MRRTLRWLATIALAVFATYLVAGNRFPNTVLGSVRDQPQARAFRDAVVAWPGRVARPCPAVGRGDASRRGQRHGAGQVSALAESKPCLKIVSHW